MWLFMDYLMIAADANSILSLSSYILLLLSQCERIARIAIILAWRIEDAMTTRQPNDKIKLNYYYWKDHGEEDTVSGVASTLNIMCIILQEF